MRVPLKNVLKRLLPYAIVLLVFAGAEVTLRVFDPSLRIPLVTEVGYDGYEWYQVNRSFLRKYFPASTPLIPEFKTSLFKKEKASNGLRVFCLGESSMLGTPYQMTCNIPGIVRKQLRHHFPGREVEVINFGAAAINTNVIRDLAQELVRFQPDIVLVYTGHNEFYGPDGVGAGFPEKHFPSVIPLKYAVNDLSLAGVVRRFLQPSEDGKRGGELNLMQQVSEGNRVRLESPEGERVLKLYNKNLRDIIATLRLHHVQVIVSDVVSNLLFPPFVSDTLEVDLRNQADDVIEGAQPSDILLNAFARDTTNALMQYSKGMWELRKGNIASARRHLCMAKDNDLLKFRAPERINEIARKVCEDEGVSFVSADSLFGVRAPKGVAGDEMFWEHLHPTALGYYEIALLFVQEIVKSEGSGSEHPRQLLPFDKDSLSICWLDEAYGDLSIQHLTGRWPFTSYRRKTAVLDSSDAKLIAIAQQAYSRTLDWDEACYRSAAELWRKGDVRRAMATYEAMLEEYPYNYYAHYLLGSLLNHARRTEEALVHYRQSIALNSRFPNPRTDLGLILVNRGDFDGAISELSQSLALLTSQSASALKATIYYGLAAAYANKGSLDEALRHVDEALRITPVYSDAQALRASILRQQK